MFDKQTGSILTLVSIFLFQTHKFWRIWIEPLSESSPLASGAFSLWDTEAEHMGVNPLSPRENPSPKLKGSIPVGGTLSSPAFPIPAPCQA